jgi:hypothetical protein
MLPFEWPGLETERPEIGDTFSIIGIRAAVEKGEEKIAALWKGGWGSKEIELFLPGLTEDERQTILAGCLMNLR